MIMPGMTPEWAEAAAERARAKGCRIIQTEALARAKAVLVTSGSRDGLLHHVTRTTCTCEGHQFHGRCMHRALAILHFEAIREQRRAAATGQTA